MAFSPKLHQKLKNPKQATVSLDSLLGLLSSAYGTEELDSKNIFEKNTINWRNLSVENFTVGSKKEDTVADKQNKLKAKESGRLHVATSTTNLKPNKNTGSEIDVTLVTIKSLESLKQSSTKSESEYSRPVTDKTQKEIDTESKHKSKEIITPENTSLLSLFEVDSSQGQMEDLKSCGDYNIEAQNVKDKEHTTICGFYVDDPNHTVIFDIQFKKKTNRSKIISVFDVDYPDISINVTDTSKQTKACIKVAKNYLVSKLQYFADVDKEFGLENLEAIVKCNLNVFQWIIQWIKADIAMCKPSLNVSNLKLILSMAYHLGIDQLIEECLDYFHQNCKNVLETDCDIEVIFDEDLLFKFVKRSSNAELNAIGDDFESFKGKLFCNCIKLLVGSSPCLNVGHYSSLATLFQCGSCEKLLHYGMTDLVPCKSDCNQLDFKGELLPLHERSPSWNLSRYVELMHNDLNSWTLVYWRLWGLCHFLYCEECHISYPLGQADWCPYHPSEAEYFSMSSNISYPIGMYKCCGEKEFRFNVLKPYGGCKFKTHRPELNSDEKVKIYHIYQAHKHLISSPPPENVVTKRFVKLLKKSPEGELLENGTPAEGFWWQGLLLAPKEKKDYSIISQDILNQLRNKHQKVKSVKKHKPLTYEPQVLFGSMPSYTPPLTIKKNDSTNETSLTRSKKGKPKLVVRKAKLSNIFSLRTKMKKKISSSYVYQPTESVWQNLDSNKDNQDNQRDCEEIAMRKLVKMLTPAAPTGLACEPVAGTYIRLESDWWREHCGDTRVAGTAKNSSTVVNRTFPLSWFRRLTI